MTTYLINSNSGAFVDQKVEARDFSIAEGFVTFWDFDEGGAVRNVYSVSTDYVGNIEAEGVASDQ